MQDFYSSLSCSVSTPVAFNPGFFKGYFVRLLCRSSGSWHSHSIITSVWITSLQLAKTLMLSVLSANWIAQETCWWQMPCKRKCRSQFKMSEYCSHLSAMVNPHQTSAFPSVGGLRRSLRLWWHLFWSKSTASKGQQPIMTVLCCKKYI